MGSMKQQYGSSSSLMHHQQKHPQQQDEQENGFTKRKASFEGVAANKAAISEPPSTSALNWGPRLEPQEQRC
jgi:hypothetical protein